MEVATVEELGTTEIAEGSEVSDVVVAVVVVVGVVEETGVEELVVVFEEVVLPFGSADVVEAAGSMVGWNCVVGLVLMAAGVITGVAGFGGATTFC